MMINTDGLGPSVAPIAEGHPYVKGMCPTCGWQSLFLAVGGYVTCSNLLCANPVMASEVLRALEGDLLTRWA